MSALSWYLVAYDIRDQKRLRQVATMLENYGERIQASVFRCALSQVNFAKLKNQLLELTEPEDSLFFLPVCKKCSEKGQNRAGDAWVVSRKDFEII